MKRKRTDSRIPKRTFRTRPEPAPDTSWVRPGQAYRWRMPGGGLIMLSGRDIIAHPREAKGLIEAIHAHDVPASRAAASAMARALGTPETLLCRRVGALGRDGTSAGCLLAECHQCNEAVWVDAGYHPMIEGGARALCGECAAAYAEGMAGI